MICFSHKIQNPTQIHFYRDPMRIERVFQPVILLSNALSVDDLSPSEKDALQASRACFVSLPA